MLKKSPLKLLGQMEPNLAGKFLILLMVWSYYQKRAILPYVLFLVTAAMFVGRMEPNEDVLEDLT
jgi:hypothetical protein